MRTKKGIVTSNKMNKTLTVTVHNYKIHPIYKKKYRISKKYYVDNPEKKFNIGDEVIIYETRPLSKLKRWTVLKPQSTTSDK